MDFDLADALRSSYSESMGFDAECSLSGAKGGPEMELHLGLSFELEVLQQRQGGMRQVAHLVIAMHRMKHTFQKSDSIHTPLGMECTDEQLCSIIMDNLVEECVMERVQEPEGAMAKKAEGTFKRMDSPEQCTLRDHYQKSVVHYPETMVLQAVTLQGGNNHLRARFNLSMYDINMDSSTIHAKPVVLGIASSNFNLSCSMQTDSTTPILQLELCSEDQLKTISAQGDTVRFLFYKTTQGISLTTFESAKYPGWFISTSLEQRKPVEMCQKEDVRNINFSVKN
ncbi:interleukin-1 beta-like [Coregonus clupeaformis]|uniref:interleukin-1 beta-like n=1 Tax=Coregonus clupeaformis TaxID=59861 RepID=UPI001E1C6931|nr:interleukin-1 beta-like [Coregonus clupeaformis]